MLRPAFLLFAVAALAGCATGADCRLNSDCGDRHYCEMGECYQDCRLDTDCADGLICTPIGQCEPATDSGVPPVPDASMPTDGGTDAGQRDAFVPPVDAFVPPVDAFVPPVDAGPGPRGNYLDRCTVAGDCASGFCVEDTGSSRFCSRACGSHGDCADEHVCAGGQCVRDDSGEACSTATPSTCALGLCLGTPSSAECVRPCNSASDCAAGWACTEVSGQQICVDIEKPCTSGGSECPTGLCLTAGCTATCRSAADCPSRATGLGLMPYTCERLSGAPSPICVPPVLASGGDIAGADPLGASCAASGTNTCRSGLCNADAPSGPMCIQSCDAEGGCAAGFGCRPEVISGGGIALFCARAGRAPIGAACGAAADCASALCDTAGYCTRMCADGLCPTGWRCENVPGSSARICRR